MKRSHARGPRQSGIALLALLGVLALGATAVFVTRLNANSAQFDLVRKQRNAEVLQRAKSALVGYIASQAAMTAENDPGAFPCPEPSGYFGDPTYEGRTLGFCTTPAVGRFPWKTIGTEKLVDADGEPLWYVVGANWARPSSTGHTAINSDSAGQLTVDGVANAAVALIIAPGAAVENVVAHITEESIVSRLPDSSRIERRHKDGIAKARSDNFCRYSLKYIIVGS